MNDDPAAAYIPFFMVFWVGWNLGVWLWVRSRPTVEQKRLWHRRLTLASGGMFGLFLLLVFIGSGQFLPVLVFVPFLGLITWLNLRFTFYCDGCGKRSFSQQWFSSTYHCSHCGHKLR
jgi:hypothetical protein